MDRVIVRSATNYSQRQARPVAQLPDAQLPDAQLPDDAPDHAPAAQASLFDERGLPWTFRYPWVFLGLFPLTVLPVTILNGFYLGLWLGHKRQGPLSLLAYASMLLVAGGLLFGPGSSDPEQLIALSPVLMTRAVAGILVVLWFTSAFRLRAEIQLFYLRRDGIHLYLRPTFTALFSASYINFVAARYERVCAEAARRQLRPA